MKAMLGSELSKPGPTDLSRGLSHRPFVPIGLCPNLRLLPQHRHQQQQPSVPHWQCAIVSSNVSVESTISSVLSIYRGIESRAVHHTLTPSSEPIDVATNWLFLATRKNYIHQSGTMLRQLPDDSTIGCGSRNRSRSSTLWVHVLKHVNNETKIKTGTVSDNNKERRNTDKRKQNPSVYCEKKKALQENLPRVSEDAFLFFAECRSKCKTLLCDDQAILMSKNIQPSQPMPRAFAGIFFWVQKYLLILVLVSGGLSISIQFSPLRILRGQCPLHPNWVVSCSLERKLTVPNIHTQTSYSTLVFTQIFEDTLYEF